MSNEKTCCEHHQINCNQGRLCPVRLGTHKPAEAVHQIQEPTQAEKEAWIAGIDEGRTQVKRAAVADERAAFEVIASDGGKWPQAIARNANGDYLLMQTASGWEWWQARAALAATTIHHVPNAGKMIAAAAAPVVLPEPAIPASQGMCCGNFDSGGYYMGQTEQVCCGSPVDAHPAYYTEQQVRALLAGVSAPAAQAEKKLPQSEGADYFVILDQKAGTVEFAYTADLGRSFGHDHIKDAQERDSTTAHRWVVRPAYASPQAHDDKGARMKVAAALDCEGVNFAWSYLTGAIKELVKAERELVQLKPLAQADASDAARYRWLRDVSVPPHNFYLSVPDEFKDERYTSREVDAAIDAAQAAQGDAHADR